MEHEERFGIIVVGVAALSAMTATVISGILLSVIFPPRIGIHSLPEFLETVFLYGFLTLIPGGTFGFLAGIPVGFWWLHRRECLPSRGRIFAEAAGLGAVFGLAFPFYFRWVIGWTSGYPPSLVVFSVIDGAVCVVVVAAVLVVRMRARWGTATEAHDQRPQ